jgi:hypothetical protein
VIDDPDDLLGEQPRINRVVDRADAENSVPAFQVPPGVPAQRGDAIAELDAVPFQPLRDTQCAGADFGVIGAVQRPFDRARDHRAVGVIDRGMVDDPVAKQRPILHETEHENPPERGRFSSLRDGGRTAPALPQSSRTAPG